LNLKKEFGDLKELATLARDDEGFQKDLLKKKSLFIQNIEKLKLLTLLSGKYDKLDAILQIYSGAGGVDAQDFATMLLRMYQRYLTSKGFGVKILSQSFGEGGGPDSRIGTKSVILEVKGRFAYGFLKKESGVHRLVRISPFSSKNLRHTSFALVEVLPCFKKSQQTEIVISPEDLRIETFRASGPGGQYVNRRESAVRITHIPTNIKVSCQNERSQGINKEKAMSLLYSKLYILKKEKRKEMLKEIKGDSISASWGNQIRSYVVHPYKIVKDLRTGVETSDVNSVFDGDLDKFIQAEIEKVDDKI